MLVEDRLPWVSRMARRWYETHTLSAARIPTVAQLSDRKRAEGVTVSVVLPAVNEASTIGDICTTIRRELMQRSSVVDELVVIDGGSTDETAFIAESAGAEVHALSSILPELPAVQGKGESLWRSLTVTRGDLVVWIDADIKNFHPRFVTRLVAPLLLNDDALFVKGFYQRPLTIDGLTMPNGGGRVTELLARPLLNALFPELAGFVQPLSGEYAGRREALERVPFFTGYGVEAGLLIDLLDVGGLEGMWQADLDVRVHRNRPLSELSPMAYTIAQTILQRAEERGRLKASIDYPTHPLLTPMDGGGVDLRRPDQIERPPVSLLPSYLGVLSGSEVAALR